MTGGPEAAERAWSADERDARAGHRDLLAGALNAYSGAGHAFGDEAREIGLILAAHAAVAVRVVGERDTLELNVKLREVAQRLAETGELDGPDTP